MPDVPEYIFDPSDGPKLKIVSPDGNTIYEITVDNNGEILANAVKILTDANIYGEVNSIPPVKLEDELEAAGGWSTAVSLTSSDFQVGTYELAVSFNWRTNSTGKSFIAEVVVDDTDVYPVVYQRPKSASSKQRMSASMFVDINIATAGSHQIDLNFKCESSKNIAYISNSYMNIRRIS
jgi:hypothetical protein